MDASILQFLNLFYGMLKERPDLFVTVFAILSWYLERTERKSMTKSNLELIAKMHEQNQDTNTLLENIKLLLEVLTKGRR